LQKLAPKAYLWGKWWSVFCGKLWRLTLCPPGNLTSEEFHAQLKALATGSERLPNLESESFTRESFYRGPHLFINGRRAIPG
jgi:hypothetical protein